MPDQYHPVADVMSDDELTRFMSQIRQRIERTVAQLPRHETYVRQYGRSELER